MTAVNMQEVMDIKISMETVVVGGIIFFLFIFLKDMLSTLSKRLTKRFLGGDTSTTTDTVITTHHDSSSAQQQCPAHTVLMAEHKYVMKHIAWTGRVMLLVAQKLDLRGLPEEPEE